MDLLGMTGTKWNIFLSAVELFSASSYNEVTMNQIAKQVGIKAASMYNHFDSKSEILDKIFEFYEVNGPENQPDLDHLLAMVDTTHPHELLQMTEMHYDPKAQPILDRIAIILSNIKRSNPRAERILYHHVIETPTNYFTPLLERMMALGRIEPIDIHSFVFIYVNTAYSASLRQHSPHPVGRDEWDQGLRLLYSLIKVKK